MTALPYLNSPALVALVIFFAELVGGAAVAAFFGWSGRHRDDVFRYDTPRDERQEETR